MKKILSIFLAVILAFSAFTMVSFAEETETTVPVEEAPSETPDEPADSMFAKWWDEHIDNGNIINTNCAFKINSESYNDIKVGNMTIKVMCSNMCSKDGKVVFDLSFKFGFLTIKAKEIVDYNNKTASYYSPSLPFFYISLPISSDTLNNFYLDTSDLVPEESRYVQVDGTEYYVEEYYDGDLRTYFKDGDLVRMERDDTLMEISYDVSDEDVSLPSLALNVTPLVILFGLFVLI